MVPESQGVATDKTAAATSSQAHEETAGDARTAWEALRMTVNYGKEYSEDTPLVGEPGSFRFSKNKDTAVTASQTKGQSHMSSSPTGTPGHSRAGSVVAPVANNSATASKSFKAGDKATPSDGVVKAKRKKSKVEGTSP